MDFHHMIHVSTTEAIANNLRLFGRRVYFTLSSYASLSFTLDAEPRKLICFLIANKWITIEDVRQSVDRGLIRYGKMMFEQIQLGDYLDHIASPQALAYAICNGAFTSKEVSSMTFDKGNTLAEFKKLADGLLAYVVEQLVHADIEKK